MDFKYIDLNDSDNLLRWNSFLSQIESPIGKLYLSPAWISAVCSGHRDTHDTIRTVACEHDNEIVAGFLLIERPFPCKIFGSRALPPLLTQYNMIMNIAKTCLHETKLLSALNTFKANRSYSELRLNTASALGSVMKDQVGRLSLTPRQTCLIDMTVSEDALWHNIASSKKRQIKKAAKLGITVGGTLDVNDAYAMFYNTFARQGATSPVSKTFFHEIVTHTNGKFLTAQALHGEVLGYVFYHTYEHCAYYTIASANNASFSMGVPSMLMWELIRILKIEHPDVICLDLLGANIKSITDFKKDFGPHLFPYTGIEASTPIMKIARKIICFRRKAHG